MKALVLDTESTGLVSSRLVLREQLPECIEFYGALCRFNKSGSYKIEDELELLIKPTRMINEYKEGKHNIARITGITNAMVQTAPSFLQVATKIFDFIEAAPLVIAHNISHDKDILDIEAERMNYKIAWPKLLCTVEATTYLQGTRMKMMQLHEYLFGEKFADAHRAKNDVTALIRCCAELHKRGII